MKTIVLAAAAALIATGALAGDDVMTSRYGNTTIVKLANGNVLHLYYNADHTWSGTNNGQPMSGTWQVTGDTLCVSFANAPAGTPANCAPVAPHQVGDSWVVGEGAGRMEASIVAGHQ